MGYQFKGKHANACKGAGGGGGGAGAPAEKKGLSIGSIILIVALVCSVIYLAAGVGWQYRKGERGVVGLLPHKGFWSSIPGLVKEGVLFSYTSIRARFSNYNYQPPTTNHQPPTTNHTQPPTTRNHQPRTTPH